MMSFKSSIKKAFTTFVTCPILCNKKIKLDIPSLPVITHGLDEIKYLYECSNILIRIDGNQDKGYFRVCDRNEPLRNKILRYIDMYFSEVVTDQNIECASVKESLRDDSNWRKFVDMGNYTDPTSRARKFFLTKDTEVVGIIMPHNLDNTRMQEYIKNIDRFLKFIMNAINSNRINRGSGEYETYALNRSIATSIVARHLGLNGLIPSAEIKRLKIADKNLIGLMVDEAEGQASDVFTYEEASELASPKLQKLLMDLSVLDLICFERDHRPGNYNVVLREGKIVNLISFDNDSTMSFAPLPAFMHKGSGCSCLIKGGLINRPFLSKELADTVLALNIKELLCELTPYLNRFQRFEVERRIRSLKKAIIKSVQKRKTVLLNDEEWTEQTMQKELSGLFGCTYLYKFIHFEELNRSFVEYNK